MSANLQLRWGILRPSDNIEADFITIHHKTLKAWKSESYNTLLGSKALKKSSEFSSKNPMIGVGSWRFSSEIAHRSKLPPPLKQKIHPALPKLGSPCLKEVAMHHFHGRETNQALKINLSSCFDACCKRWGTKRLTLKPSKFQNLQWTENMFRFFLCLRKAFDNTQWHTCGTKQDTLAPDSRH